MILIVILDILSVALICSTVYRKGFERALPLVAFLLLLLPSSSRIDLPGLFDLTTQRLIILVLGVLYFTIGKNGARRRESLPLRYLILLQIVWMVVSTANSAVFGISVKTVLSQVLDYFLVFYIVAKAVTREQTIHKILYALVAAMIVCSVLGTVEAYTEWSVTSLFPALPSRFVNLGPSDRGIRVQSTFIGPIFFGGALAMTIPLTMYFIPKATTTLKRVILWIGLMLMFLNIYKTGSRGAWLALVLSLGVLFVFGYPRTRRYVLAIVILAAMVLVLRPGVWHSLSNMYLATKNPDSSQGESYQWRYALYDIAVEETGKSFSRALWGYGPESFYYLGLTTEFRVDGVMHTVAVESCDSSFAALLIETGYVGLLITALLLLGPAFITYRNYRRMPARHKTLCLILLANMLSFYFMMTNVAFYANGQQNYLLWIIIALAMIYPRIVMAQRRAEAKVQPGSEMVSCAVPA